MVSSRSESLPYLEERGIVGGQQTASQCIGQQLAAQGVEEILLALLTDKLPQSRDPVPFRAARERCRHIDRLAAHISGAQLPDRTVSLEDQTIGVESGMATGTGGILSVRRQRLTEGKISQFALVAR